MGLSPARVTCETSHDMLAGGQMVFPHLVTHLTMSEIILMGRKTKIKKIKETDVTYEAYDMYQPDL